MYTLLHLIFPSSTHLLSVVFDIWYFEQYSLEFNHNINYINYFSYIYYLYNPLFITAAGREGLLKDNMEPTIYNETDWKDSFFDKDGDFNIKFTGTEPGKGQTGRDEIYYARVDEFVS